MVGILKHRVWAFALVAVFGVFNVGIPIVVASCPMAAMMKGAKCPMCDDRADMSTPNVGTEMNWSCCVTTIIAERNTNEFVQAPSRPLDSPMHDVVPFESAFSVNNHSLVSLVAPVSTSPPVVVNIPILISSLII